MKGTSHKLMPGPGSGALSWLRHPLEGPQRGRKLTFVSPAKLVADRSLGPVREIHFKRLVSLNSQGIKNN